MKVSFSDFAWDVSPFTETRPAQIYSLSSALFAFLYYGYLSSLREASSKLLNSSETKFISEVLVT